MWETIKQIFTSIGKWFTSLTRPAPAENTERTFLRKAKSSYRAMPHNPVDDEFVRLKYSALSDPIAVRKLLSRDDLKTAIDKETLCQIIYYHRTKIPINDIEWALSQNDLSLTILAKHSVSNAIFLLRSRFVRQFSAIDLANIYYTHRHEQAFLKAILTSVIPPLSFILIKAKIDGMIDRVSQIIASSATLMKILNLEVKSDPRYEPVEYVKGGSEPSPYEVLGIPYDASEQVIKKAYRAMVLQVHPDKIETIAANRFKAVQAAYDLLIDPDQKEAWDRAHFAHNIKKDQTRRSTPTDPRF